VQVVAALVEALHRLEAEGGPVARGARYAANFRTLADGMTRLGFRLFLESTVQAPIIATFHTPADPRFRFDRFYSALAARGFVIYPGKLTHADSFRIGCIGDLKPPDFKQLIAAVADFMEELGLSAVPAPSSAAQSFAGV
jgi:2-aminoethylphosphonate-pyruvate transaminase